jgi:hypothetical protein
MKHDGFIGLFLLLALLAACTSVPEPVETPSPELLAIDSLMWQQPDSALLALMAYEGDASEYNDHYAQLLTSELLYKNDYGQTNRPELQQAVAYFDSLLCQFPPLQRGLGGFKTRTNPIDQIAFLDARAHYINGVGYYERDSVIEACREYLKALEVMEGHFEEKELVKEKANFMAMTYTRLTVLFSDLYLNKQAIYFGKLSLPYYERNKTSPWHLPWILSKIGAHYNVMEELDSADYYFQQAKTILPDTVSQMYRDIVAQQALLSYHMEHQSEEPIATLHRMADLAISDDERLARYLSIADIYYNEQLFDSAKIYFEYVFDNTQKPDIRMFALDMLRDISMTDGDTLKANEYALARSQFTIEKDKEGQLHSDLTTLCQQYEQSRQEAQHKLKSQKAVRRWGIALVFIVVVVSLLLLVLKRRMKTERHAHKMQQAALTGKLRKSNETVRELKGQLQQQGNDAVSKPEQANSFADEPICQLIMERVNEGQFKSQMDCTVYKDYALGKEQLMALREAADRHFNRFTSRLAQTYPSLTKNDLDYCCLYLLGLTDADISALMQRAYNTVSERSRKLKTIFDSEVALPVTIRSLANGFASV